MEKSSGVLRGLIVLSAALCAGGLPTGLAGDLPDGQLKVVGERVERLVLVDQDGHSRTYSGDDLSTAINLAPGTYRPQEIRLKGGYACHLWSEPEFAPVKVETGEVAELKAGAPLTQGLTIERQGKMLVLRHELRGMGGEMYAVPQEGTPPEFAVYKGDKKVGGGQFEYG